MKNLWGLLLLGAGGYWLWKQQQAKANATPAYGPEHVAALPVGSAAVVLTQQPVSSSWPLVGPMPPQASGRWVPDPNAAGMVVWAT
jgi:hypothetical protein